jgi:ABC-2 type transport system permease protein
MTTTTTTSAAAADTGTPLARFGDVLAAEFYKLRSVPSTRWTLLAALASNVLLAALAAIFIPSRLSTADRRTTDAVRLSLAGLHLSQIAIGVLGALVITSEYGTGMIRASFAAVPRRRTVLAAKAIVFLTTATLAGIASCFAAFYVFQAFLSGQSGDAIKSSIGDPGVARAVAGGGLYLAVLGMLGLGLGVLIRASAGTIATLFGLLFVPSILVSVLPSSWQDTVGKYLPMNAGEQIFIATHHEAHSLSAWTGFGVFALYAAAALAAGFLLITRRDT